MASQKKLHLEKTRGKGRPLFAKDEMKLCSINPSWSEDELLDQEGIFYLKDVVQALNMPSASLKKMAMDMEAKGLSSWEEMGIRKTWTHWIVRMKKFADFFYNNDLQTVLDVDPRWDANELLEQKGLYYLTDVCAKLPFTAHQIRYQVRRNRNSREDFGVWKDEKYRSYIVDMEVFSEWIYRIWTEGTR